MTNTQHESHWEDTACLGCQLSKDRKQIVVATPCRKGGLLAIGEAPGCEEDCQGTGFIGKAGKRLDAMLLVHGIERSDYGRANVCRCRPPENRPPKTAEITACLPYLVSLISETQPRVILAVGRTPTSLLCGTNKLHVAIADRKEHGYQTSVELARQELRSALGAVPFIVPMPHTSPLSLNRNAPSGEKWSAIAERQIARAVSLMK